MGDNTSVTSSPRDRIWLVLEQYLPLLGYTCLATFGFCFPAPPLDQRPRPYAGPPPGHPERLATAPLSRAEKQLWRQLRSIR
jgi:hypothetical protein